MGLVRRPWYRMMSMVLTIALVTAMLPVPAFAVKEEIKIYKPPVPGRIIIIL